MAQAPDDVAWVAAVLQGNQGAAGSSAGRPTQQRAIRRIQGTSGSRQGAQSRRQQATPSKQCRQEPAEPSATRYTKRSRSPRKGAREKDVGAKTGSAAAAAPASAVLPRQEGEQQDLGRPGPQSTQRALHCEACDCWVPRRPGDWETHVAGIRHRRQVLSLRTFGERGRLVLSAFESPPAPSEPAAAQRLVGKAARDFGLVHAPDQQQQQQQHEQQGGSAGWLPPEQRKQLAQLRTSALGLLLSMFGHSNIYHAAASAFEAERVLIATHELALSSANELLMPSGMLTYVAPTGSALAAVAWQLAQGPGGSAAASATTLRILCCGPEDSAANPAAAFATRPPSQCASLLVGLALVFRALQRHTSLLRLRVELPKVVYTAAMHQAWQHVLLALKQTLERNPCLRSVVLHVPAMYGLRDLTLQAVPGLQEAAAAAARPVREHLLLALHPRVGRCSLLQLLPLPLLRQVLDLAAPLEPCSIEVP